MIKKIVAFTVAVLFTFLLGCQSTNTGITFANNSSNLHFGEFSGEVIHLSSHSAFNFFVDSYKQWAKSLLHHDDEQIMNDFSLTNHFDGTQLSNVRISDYDELFMRLSFDHGQDWRFISAIAYNESRFNPTVVSSQGAKGLMQIMPVVARQFNVSNDQITDPEVNVVLAIKLLNKLGTILTFSDDTSEQDQKKIILACYNGGVGHVLDARRLARKYGANPDSWDDVAFYLKAKADAFYHQDEVVTCGVFRGSSETLSFVDKVMNKYDSYCSL